MAWFLKASDDRGAARNERLFREAMRGLTREMDAILARNAAAGCLKSGATIKALVQAMHSTTAEALNEALRGIGAVTEHAGRKRQGLLERLRTSLAAHQETAEGTIQFAIERIGLDNDFQHAQPLIEQSHRRHREQIADFAEGWTAPAGKRWKERHPLLYDALLLIVGALIGAAIQPLANEVLPEVGVTSH